MRVLWVFSNTLAPIMYRTSILMRCGYSVYSKYCGSCGTFIIMSSYIPYMLIVLMTSVGIALVELLVFHSWHAQTSRCVHITWLSFHRKALVCLHELCKNFEKVMRLTHACAKCMTFSELLHNSCKHTSAFLWKESHVIWTHLEVCACQEWKTRSSTREI
jgi:hypothetical protein